MTYGIRYTEPVEGLELESRRREMQHLLTEHECEVTFIKVNGELRTMPCTLQESLIPTKPVDVSSKSSEKRLRALDVLSVWCLDKQEWRSFKVASVQEVRVLG